MLKFESKIAHSETICDTFSNFSKVRTGVWTR